MPAQFPQQNLLIVSDLHLSEGRHPGTGKYSPTEDFFFDEEFARLLEHYQNRQAPGTWHLIINGDFLDILQVTSLEGALPTLSRDPRRPDFGAGCGEPETVFKLGKIVAGHPRFFEALASFVGVGNLLTIIKGNHDVEFHYRQVQAAFISQLQAVCAGALAGHNLNNISSTSVLFSDWFYYEKGCLWVEHGNQYDGLNTFTYGLCPLLPRQSPSPWAGKEKAWPENRKNEIDLPWGSLFVRYLFNKIEGVEPFADNIKPQTKFVSWLLRHHPITAVKFACEDGTYMLGKIRRAWAPLPADAYEARKAQHDAAMQDLAAKSDIPLEKLHYVDDLRAPSLLKQPTGLLWKSLRRLVQYHLLPPLLYAAIALFTIAALLAISPFVAVLLPAPLRQAIDGRLSTDVGVTVLSVLRWLALLPVIITLLGVVRWLVTPEEKRQAGFLKKVAENIAQCLKVKYVVMGHTHDPELQRFGDDCEYFNTGTWTRVFSEEERLLREDVEFTFLEGIRKADGLHLKLMKWDDHAREPRLLPLLEDNATKVRQPAKVLAQTAGKAA